MKKLQLFLILALSIAISANLAYAQVDLFQEDDDEEGPKVLNPYDDKYKPDLKIEQPEGSALVPNFIYFAGFIRKPNASADDLNLYIFSPGSVFGCLDIENPSIEPVQIGPALHLKLTDGYIGADTETVRYFHYECKPGPGQSEMHLSLSKEKLLKDGINKLVIVSEEIGPFNDMILDFKEHSVVITSKIHDLSIFGLPAKGGEDTFTYWIYPENTMALFSSSADMRDEDTLKNVRDLARRRGLTPLDEIITDFEPRYGNTDKLYVVDTTGRYKAKLAKPNDVFSFGQIEAKELYFGSKGAYDKVITKTIFAKRPGLYE